MKKIPLLLLVIVATLQLNTLRASDVEAPSRNKIPLNGRIISKEDNSPISYATIFIEGSNFGTVSDEHGRYRLPLTPGEHKLVVKVIGYNTHSQTVNIAHKTHNRADVSLTPSSTDIDAVEINGENGTQRVNKTAFNVQAIAIDDLKNTTASLTDVLSKANGVRIREAGGVGSDTKISLNGFSGNYVKIFIDGVLQSGNSAFSLNNIPANFAERIEVYSGAAPIEFGSDALGGVINIVTKRQNQAGWDLDASYSYGSFNTHRSNVTFTHQLDNGFQYKVNAYQNYSDNNYKINNTVFEYLDDGRVKESEKIYTLERFNDTYHNEAAIAEVGLRGKSWADVATLSMNYSQFYKEVQTGTTQDIVYGDRHQSGYALIPTFQYSKRDLFAKGLTIKTTASYNHGITTVIDTTDLKYNWFGDTKDRGSYTPTNRQVRKNSLSLNANASYKATEAHTLALNYSYNSTTRSTREANTEYADQEYYEFGNYQYTKKGITGLSYMYRPVEAFNIQAFGKMYIQNNDGTTTNPYTASTTVHHQKNLYWGYGGAATYFFLKGFQAKASYELAYRLPTSTELFGDGDLEIGTANLKPESSNNYNASISYAKEFNKHSFRVEGGVVYSISQDFIKRVVTDDGESAYYQNWGEIRTNGWNASLNYGYGRLLSVGGSFNVLNARDNERYNVDNGNESLTYGVRLPNEPFMYASVDGRVNFYDVIKKRDHLYVVYSMLYQHSFPLDWENFADPTTQLKVPTQFSHDISLHYSLKGGKYNFTLECKNITNARLYDNYCLQKAGRALYGKVRVNFGNVNRK